VAVRLLSFFLSLFAAAKGSRVLWLVLVLFSCPRSRLSACSSIRPQMPLFCVGVSARPHHHPGEVD